VLSYFVVIGAADKVRSYLEAIDIMYTANVFSLKGTCGLTAFESVVPMPQWQMIRHLHISTIFLTPKAVMPARKHFPPEDFSQWPLACRTLRDMRGLRLLQIEIIVRDFERRGSAFVDNESLELILEPLSHISVPLFEVEMNMPMPETLLAKLGHFPFKLAVKQRPYNRLVGGPIC
jgi:hypothetical protein